MTTLFQEGEVVLGKIKGYPYWPAKIIEISNTMTYTIKFFSDNSYAKLSSKYILKYKENKNKILEANKKNKKLVSSFREADLDIKKSENINNIPDEQKIITNDETLPNLKANINSQNISSKTLNSNNNFEPKNLEKINKNNNLINLSEIMSGQNNRVNIFSITKNSKNIITINNSNSQTIEDPVVEDTHNSQENKSAIIESDNNNHIIIDKNILNIENDEELSSLLQNNKNNLENKMESEKSLKTVNEKKEEIKETKPEKYFLRIEIENLEVKNNKKKEIKKKIKVDDKIKEEKKKREEEDNFLYEIDEYEKVQFRRVLIYLANFKRKNFVEFLKMTNISKYIQYFVCYLKDYDQELSTLAKNVYRNFHKQFNKEYFSNKMYKV